MDKKRLLTAVERFINKRGGRADAGALAEILVNMIENPPCATVAAAENTEINGHHLPELTEDGKKHFVPTRGAGGTTRKEF